MDDQLQAAAAYIKHLDERLRALEASRRSGRRKEADERSDRALEQLLPVIASGVVGRDRSFTTREALDCLEATAPDVLLELTRGGRMSPRSLGWLLRRARGRIIGGIQLDCLDSKDENRCVWTAKVVFGAAETT